MPSLSVARAGNAKFAPIEKPVIVVFGGTSGIGAGTVEAFARHSNGRAHIIVIGRSKPAADALFASLPQHAESQYEFLAVDCLYMRNIKSAAAQLRQRLQKINYLVLSQGGVLLGKPPTDEGLDPMMAVALYGRVRTAFELAPLLENAAAAGEEARVMTVVYAGIGGPVDLNDLALKNFRIPWDIKKARGAMVTYTDIYTLELAKLYPTVSFTHIYPGFVASGLKRGMPVPLRLLFGFLEKLAATSPGDCGEWMMYALLDPSSKSGAHFRSDKADVLKASAYADEKTREVVWKYIQETSDPKPAS